MTKLHSLALFVIATILTASFGFAAENVSFHAKTKLGGKDEVPKVKTKAKGDADFKLSNDRKEMTYKVTVKDIQNPTAAHIHNGKKGAIGPPVANLFTGPKKQGKFSGVLAEGTLTEKDLTGDLKGKTLDALVDLIKSDSAYVNVHTEAFPDGEIRGQLK